MLYFFSPYAQLRDGGKNQDDNDSADGKRGGRGKVARVARH